MRAAAYFSPRSWRPRWRRGRVGSVPCASLRTWLEGRIIGESHPPPLHWPKRVTRMVSIEGRAERARSAERRGHAERLLRVSKPGWGAAEGSRVRHRCRGSGWHQGHRRLLQGGARRRAGGPTSCSSPREMGGLWLSSGLRFKTILLVRLSEGDWAHRWMQEARWEALSMVQVRAKGGVRGGAAGWGGVARPQTDPEAALWGVRASQVWDAGREKQGSCPERWSRRGEACRPNLRSEARGCLPRVLGPP